MKVTTQRQKIQSVAERWRKQYPVERCESQPDKAVIYEKLCALDLNTCSADEVNKIIGNSSWTRFDGCHECGNEEKQTVMLGQEPDYESYTAWICADCLRKALKLIEAAQ